MKYGRHTTSRWLFFAQLLAVIVLQRATTGHVCAQEFNSAKQGTQAEEILARRGSLTLQDATLPEALFTISKTWNVNLLFGKELNGHVNGVFRDVTLREVLDSLLLANGYGYRSRGQSLIIMSLEALGDSNAMLQTVSIPMPEGRGDDIVEAAQILLSPQGKIHAMNSVNALMVSDYPDNIRKVQNFVTSFYRPNQRPSATSDESVDSSATVLSPVEVDTGSMEDTVAYFSPRHTTAEALRETFETFLGPEAKVVVVATENRLAIVARPDEIRLARRIFSELDLPREQVRITALIYDVNIGELERLGVNWTHNVKAGMNAAGVPTQAFGGKFGAFPDPTTGAFTIGDATGAAVDAATTSSTLGAARLTTLNRYFDLNTVISALDQVDGSRLLADPSITVLDREEASIKIITEVPVQQLTETAAGGSIGTTSFREAGVTLTVTPQIGDDGTITMQVSPTFSVLSGFTDGQPIIDSRKATTVVRITNGQTLVLGGLRQRSEVETLTGIPKLMKLKHFGKLFREHNTTIRESELIVFLRPEVVQPDSMGTPRQAAGLCVAHKALSKLNWPSEMPVVPSCNDPNCPYHYPRPRFFNSAEVGGIPMEQMNSTYPESTVPNVPEAYDQNPEPSYDQENPGEAGGAETELPPLPDPIFNPPADSVDVSAKIRTSRKKGAIRFASQTSRSASSVKRSRATTISHSTSPRTDVPTPVNARKKKRSSAWPEWLDPIRKDIYRSK